MEEKEKKNKKKSKLDEKATATQRVLGFIKEEHPFENWLLFILSLVLLVLSAYILISAVSDKNTFADTYFNIANSGWAIFNEPWKVITISAIILAIALVALLYSLYPVFKPSFKEMKLVTWTSKKTLFLNSVIVLAFIAFLTALFYLFDLGLIPLFKLVFGE
ncbi:MAG: preprotein translocase subunit SecE [Gammaproteobacteria bacterium]|nr:preprotein translocase subunit SecE [Gammaproteobacteria bacterium]